jgi:hypothetical protein
MPHVACRLAEGVLWCFGMEETVDIDTQKHMHAAQQTTSRHYHHRIMAGNNFLFEVE